MARHRETLDEIGDRSAANWTSELIRSQRARQRRWYRIGMDVSLHKRKAPRKIPSDVRKAYWAGRDEGLLGTKNKGFSL